MACGLGAAMDRVVLGRGDDAIVVRIVTLHPSNKSDGHAGCEERIFTIGLLAASPARITKDVDVGSPEIEAFEDVGVSGAFVLSVLDTAFDADGGRHLVNARRVEGRGEADGLGKFCGAVDCDAM